MSRPPRPPPPSGPPSLTPPIPAITLEAWFFAGLARLPPRPAFAPAPPAEHRYTDPDPENSYTLARPHRAYRPHLPHVLPNRTNCNVSKFSYSLYAYTEEPTQTLVCPEFPLATYSTDGDGSAESSVMASTTDGNGPWMDDLFAYDFAPQAAFHTPHPHAQSTPPNSSVAPAGVVHTQQAMDDMFAENDDELDNVGPLAEGSFYAIADKDVPSSGQDVMVAHNDTELCVLLETDERTDFDATLIETSFPAVAIPECEPRAPPRDITALESPQKCRKLRNRSITGANAICIISGKTSVDDHTHAHKGESLSLNASSRRRQKVHENVSKNVGKRTLRSRMVLVPATSAVRTNERGESGVKRARAKGQRRRETDL